MQAHPQNNFPEGTNYKVFDGNWEKMESLSLSKILYTSEKTISEKWNACRDGKYKHREKRGELYICRSHHKFSKTRM